ncbi:MAG: hypothetical protein NTY42_24060 [Planctomycetota bacterium]|nr:hypothetical protein [Planctomycetota bacterium]
MGGITSRRGKKANRSQLLAFLTSSCIALTSQSVAVQTVLAQSKSKVEFNIKPTNGSVVSAGSTMQEVPIRLSLPVSVPASTSMNQMAPLPMLPPAGLPTFPNNQSSLANPLGLPANPQSGKVQMRLSSEEPPKLPVSATSSMKDAVRFNVAADLPRPQSLPSQSLPSQSPQKQVAAQKTGGPVKFNLGDAGVTDFGFQGPSISPPSLSRAPELVKPKKFSVGQTVVLAQSSELTEGTDSVQPLELDGKEIIRSGVYRQNVVTQANSNASSETPREAVSQEKPASSGVVALPKPSKSKSVADRNLAELAGSTSSGHSEAITQDSWHSVEVEREYDIELLGTYSIDAPFEIVRIETQDPECCSVFNNGRAITVVGKAEGSSKVAIISKDHQRRVVGVKVLSTGQQPATPKSDLDQVKEMIANLFPDANLSFTNQDSGGIEVRGTTKSEGEARKVLEIVRRICLVPVEDKVKVQP